MSRARAFFSRNGGTIQDRWSTMRLFRASSLCMAFCVAVAVLASGGEAAAPGGALFPASLGNADSVLAYDPAYSGGIKTLYRH